MSVLASGRFVIASAPDQGITVTAEMPFARLEKPLKLSAEVKFQRL
jgi:hypothetical protein